MLINDILFIKCVNIGELDVSGKTYTFDEWFRAISVVFDVVCFLDARAYQNGVTFLMDAKGVSLSHLLFFGFENSCQQFSFMQVIYTMCVTPPIEHYIIYCPFYKHST